MANWVGVLLEVVALAGGGAVGYFSAYSALNARVAVLEAQYILLMTGLGEIKTDLREMRRLLERQQERL